MTFRLHLKNFQSIKEATLDIAPLTFLVGPNAAGKSAVSDALAALSLSFGRKAADVNWEKIKSFHRDPGGVMSYGIGADLHFDESPFYYTWLPFSDSQKRALIENEYDLDRGGYHKLLKSGDVIFHYDPSRKNIGQERALDIYLNDTLAVSCSGIDLEGEVTFCLSNPVIKAIFDGLDIDSLIDSQIDGSEVKRTHDQVIIGCVSDVGGAGEFFGLKIYNYNSGSMAFIVIEYIVNALMSAIAIGSGAFWFGNPLVLGFPDGDSDDFGWFEGIGALPHLGPLRTIPREEKWWVGHATNTASQHMESKPAGWHDGGSAWLRIARSIAEQHRQGVCESMGLKPVHTDHDIKSEDFYINSRLAGYVTKLNAVMNGEPLRLGYKITGQVDVSLPLSGSELPFSARTIAGADYSVSIRVVDEKERQHLLSDVGVGVSQLIPVLFAGLTRPFSIIEQPELHLHPKLQLELSSFFIERVGEGRRFILETHSENMLLRVLRAIRETGSADIQHRQFNLKPDQVSVLYFEKLVDSTTQVHRLRISDDGEFLDRWPGGFFAEREAELF